MSEATLLSTLQFDERRAWSSFCEAAAEFITAAGTTRFEYAQDEWRYRMRVWQRAHKELKDAEAKE